MDPMEMDFLQNTVEHLRGLPQKETMNFRAPAMVFGIGPGLLCCYFHLHLRYELSGLRDSR